MDLISLGISSFLFFFIVIPGLLILLVIVFYILLIPFLGIGSVVLWFNETFHPQKHSSKTKVFLDSDIFKGKDPLFEDAIRLICQHDKASASLLQRRLSIGFTRAACILDQLEESGIIAPGEGSNPRDVLMNNLEEFLSKLNRKTNNKT